MIAGPFKLQQSLRLRAEPSLETLAPMAIPFGASVEVAARKPPNWVRVTAEVDGQSRAGWCLRCMLDAALNQPMPAFPAAERRMWDLVRQYTGRVGYRRGAKASSLHDTPPVIDCSGWVALLLTEAMQAQNADAGEDVFDVAAIDVDTPWSDRILLEIEARTPLLLEGPDITGDSLPRCATVAINEGHHDWQRNRPRLRGINHIAQVVRRPSDGAAFVSESYGDEPGGVRLAPLADWLDVRRRDIRAGNAWAADPFAMADPSSPWIRRSRPA